MKSKNSIKNLLFTSFASLGLFLLGTSTSILAQNYQNSFTTKTSNLNSEFSKSILQDYSPHSLSTKETKDTDMAISPWEKRIGVTGAFGESLTSLTLGFSHLYGFGSSRRFRVGLWSSFVFLFRFR